METNRDHLIEEQKKLLVHEEKIKKMKHYVEWLEYYQDALVKLRVAADKKCPILSSKERALDLRRIDAKNSVFAESILSESYFNNADLRKCSMDGADLRGIHVTETTKLPDGWREALQAAGLL